MVGFESAGLAVFLQSLSLLAGGGQSGRQSVMRNPEVGIALQSLAQYWNGFAPLIVLNRIEGLVEQAVALRSPADRSSPVRRAEVFTNSGIFTARLAAVVLSTKIAGVSLPSASICVSISCVYG